MTQVSEVMTRGVRLMSPNDSLQLAAQAMDELNIGAVPVCEADRLIGMVTDRDITVRGVAQGLTPADTPVRNVMSQNVRTCREDDSVEDVMDQMRDSQIRRIPVVDQQEHVVGILSLGDVAAKLGGDEASDALEAISEPSEPDRSSQSAASGSAGGGTGANGGGSRPS